MGQLTELRKALTSSGDGAALLPYDLDSVLHEELLKLQPLAVLLGLSNAEGKTHEYNVRSSHPYAWFEGEETGANNQNSVYARATVQLKIQRIWGSVTGFAQAVDAAFIDALETELIGSIEGMSNVMEYGAMWGTADDIGFTGDSYQFSGIIPRMFSYAPGNVVDAGGNKIELGDLDNAFANVAKWRQTRNDPFLWFMGLRMKAVVDGLQTKVQMPITSAELADGKIVMDTYSRSPIFETDFVVPDATPTTPSDLAGVAAAGGALIDGDWNYRISSVTLWGEQTAAAELGTDITTATTNNSVDLTFTADANAKLYMIWRQDGGGAGDYGLLDIIPAKTYNADGSISGTVATYSDEGARAVKAVKPLETDEQNILIANANPARGASWKTISDNVGAPVDRIYEFLELAKVKDTYDYMMKGYLTLKVVYPNLFSVIRHAKLA